MGPLSGPEFGPPDDAQRQPPEGSYVDGDNADLAGGGVSAPRIWVPFARAIAPALGGQDPLHNFFAAQVESSFCEVGIADPKLSEYLTTLLIKYMHTDSLAVISSLTNAPVSIGQFYLEADDPALSRVEALDNFRTVGDFTLFWSGVFPEMIAKNLPGAGGVVAFTRLGKAAYAQACKVALGRDELVNVDARFFYQLSEDFESCRYGLGKVARGWKAA